MAKHRDPEDRRANKNTEAEILGIPVSKKTKTEYPKKNPDDTLTNLGRHDKE